MLFKSYDKNGGCSLLAQRYLVLFYAACWQLL